jgi:hypothetical protein
MSCHEIRSVDEVRRTNGILAETECEMVTVPDFWNHRQSRPVHSCRFSPIILMGFVGTDCSVRTEAEELGGQS